MSSSPSLSPPTLLRVRPFSLCYALTAALVRPYTAEISQHRATLQQLEVEHCEAIAALEDEEAALQKWTTEERRLLDAIEQAEAQDERQR